MKMIKFITIQEVFCMLR